MMFSLFQPYFDLNENGILEFRGAIFEYNFFWSLRNLSEEDINLIWYEPSDELNYCFISK